jgi:branched-chain amino acid transport system substrate-binding protein
MRRRTLLSGLAAAPFTGAVRAATLDKPLRIAVMNSMSDTYAAGGGPGSVACARMAVEDFGGKVAGVPVELLALDHHNKADVGVSLALQAYDQQGVDAMFDIGNSAVSLAVQDIARQRGKILIHVGSAHDALYGKSCSPTGALWVYDTYSLSRGLTKAVFEQGGTSWFFITADYAFGHQMQDRSSEVLVALGGKIAGSVAHPLGETDFSSYLVQAMSSGATTIALVSAGNDTVNAAKQASEFGVGRGRNTQTLATPIFYLNSAHEVGAEGLQGLQYLTAFYWDYDAGSRKIGERFAAARGGAYPNQAQAGNYSAALHYLKAVEAAGSRDGLTVMRQMKAMPVSDPFARGATLRQDGRLMHDYFLAEVKTPAEVKQGWDLLDIKAVVPAASVIRPIDQGGCSALDPA